MPELTQAEEREFEAKADLRTLVEAAEIKGDRQRMRRAREMAKKQMEALENVRNA